MTPGSEHEQALSFLDDKTEEESCLPSSNSVWVREGIKESYVEAVVKAGGSASLLTSAAEVNAKVSEDTNGLLDRIVDDALVSNPLTKAVLVNAIFFKANWETQFKVEETREGETFAGKYPCAMMKTTRNLHYKYSNVAKAHAVALEYEGPLRAVFVLPDDDVMSTLERLSDWSSEISPSATRQISLSLPRFELEFEADLLKHFPSCLEKKDGGFLGMSDAPDLHLSNLLHKTKVKVDEQGTEAAATTAAVMQTRSLAVRPPLPLRFDKPFIFAVEDIDDNLVFVGIVNKV